MNQTIHFQLTIDNAEALLSALLTALDMLNPGLDAIKRINHQEGVEILTRCISDLDKTASAIDLLLQQAKQEETKNVIQAISN